MITWTRNGTDEHTSTYKYSETIETTIMAQMNACERMGEHKGTHGHTRITQWHTGRRKETKGHTTNRD